MTVVAQRLPLSLHPSLVVARFTLLSVLRRRWLAVAGGLGLALLVVDGVYSKDNDHVNPLSSLSLEPHRLANQVFLSSSLITAVIVGGLTMVVAMSIIRDDLGSGAGELLLTKPLPRPWYALGKIATLAVAALAVAAFTAVVRIAVLLLVMDDSAYVGNTLIDSLAICADAFVIGLIVLAVSSWGSSLAAALVAVILFLLATMSAPLVASDQGRVAEPDATLVRLAYDLSPRMLNGPRDEYFWSDFGHCDVESGHMSCTSLGRPYVITRPWSSALDVLAWAGYGAGTTVFMLLGIRRFSGGATD